MGMQAMSQGVRFIIMDDANFYNGGGHRSYPGKTNEFAGMGSLAYPMKRICANFVLSGSLYDTTILSKPEQGFIASSVRRIGFSGNPTIFPAPSIP
jgi:hypothetical protein